MKGSDITPILQMFDQGYSVSKEGYILDTDKNPLSFRSDRDGYFRIYYKGHTVHVHRIVAYSKHGLSLFAAGIHTRHLDGNRQNNRPDNITIGTAKQNSNDRPKQERLRHATHAASFLKKYDNQAIRAFYKECKSYKKTMRHFNISSKGTLHYILNKRCSNKAKNAVPWENPGKRKSVEIV